MAIYGKLSSKCQRLQVAVPLFMTKDWLVTLLSQLSL